MAVIFATTIAFVECFLTTSIVLPTPCISSEVNEKNKHTFHILNDINIIVISYTLAKT